jgi:hypothetical protein
MTQGMLENGEKTSHSETHSVTEFSIAVPKTTGHYLGARISSWSTLSHYLTLFGQTSKYGRGARLERTLLRAYPAASSLSETVEDFQH